MEINPFNYILPITDPRQFYGHVSVLQKLTNYMVGEPIKVVCLYGGRRSGKTSLLRMTKQTLERRFQSLEYPVVIPIYFDPHIISLEYSVDFFQQLIEITTFWITQHVKDVSVSTCKLSRNNYVRDFVEFFVQIQRTLIPITGSSIRFALLIDEEEKIRESYQDQIKGTWENLRAILSNTELAKSMGMIMSGGSSFLRDMRAPTITSPLSNIIQEHIFIPDASVGEFEYMTEEICNHLLPKEVSTKVIDLSGRSLFLGQFFLNRLWEVRNNQITTDYLEEVALNDSLEVIFRSWSASLEEHGKRIFGLLLGHFTPIHTSKIISELNLSRNDVLDGLDLLKIHGLVQEATRDHLKITTCEAFQNWFLINHQEYIPLNSWLSGIVAIYNNEPRMVGTGFLVERSRRIFVVTCLHVLWSINRSLLKGDDVNVKLNMDFELIEATILWPKEEIKKPSPVDWVAYEDIAVLEIDPKHSNRLALNLESISNYKNRDRCWTFGFTPQTGIRGTKIDSIYCVEELANEFIAIEQTDKTQMPISEGFSGAPLFDRFGSVIGMLQSVYRKEFQAYLIPSRSIAKVLAIVEGENK